MRTDPLTAIIAGFADASARAHIAGLLPPGWRLVHGPKASPDLQGGAVLSVGADGPRGEHAGARLAVSGQRLAADGGKVATLLPELGDALRAALEARTR